MIEPTVEVGVVALILEVRLNPHTTWARYMAAWRVALGSLLTR
jgi:hypothetical protein